MQKKFLLGILLFGSYEFQASRPLDTPPLAPRSYPAPLAFGSLPAASAFSGLPAAKGLERSALSPSPYSTAAESSALHDAAGSRSPSCSYRLTTADKITADATTNTDDQALELAVIAGFHFRSMDRDFAAAFSSASESKQNLFDKAALSNATKLHSENMQRNFAESVNGLEVAFNQAAQDLDKPSTIYKIYMQRNCSADSRALDVAASQLASSTSPASLERLSIDELKDLNHRLNILEAMRTQRYDDEYQRLHEIVGMMLSRQK
jgi:hypothetical protein